MGGGGAVGWWRGACWVLVLEGAGQFAALLLVVVVVVVEVVEEEE